MRDAHYRGVPAPGGPMSSTDPQRMFPDEYGNVSRAAENVTLRRFARVCCLRYISV